VKKEGGGGVLRGERDTQRHRSTKDQKTRREANASAETHKWRILARQARRIKTSSGVEDRVLARKRDDIVISSRECFERNIGS
jgi:hypothetical protein